jgi:transcriptional regulator with XRE-family HTH domain
MTDNLDKLFGNRIRELRKAKGMTQEDCAFKAGIDVSYLGYVERGQQSPTLRKIEEIAKSLEVEVAELFYFKTAKSFNKQFDILKDRIISLVEAKDTKASEYLNKILEDLKKVYL